MAQLIPELLSEINKANLKLDEVKNLTREGNTIASVSSLLNNFHDKEQLLDTLRRMNTVHEYTVESAEATIFNYYLDELDLLQHTIGAEISSLMGIVIVDLINRDNIDEYCPQLSEFLTSSSSLLTIMKKARSIAQIALQIGDDPFLKWAYFSQGLRGRQLFSRRKLLKAYGKELINAAYEDVS
jgi:hypothetical protein